MSQAEDRAHRIGQTNSVNIYYLYGSQTVDEYMIHMIMQKSEVISDALDGRQADYDIQRGNQ
jgi:SWI/SNF-related matrix-associated actin-dependent regulator 1 of chromatin subfamily A